MASNTSMASFIPLLLLVTCSSLQLTLVSSFEFQVGDNLGWAVPPSNHSKLYNHWASEKRFKLGDSIRFKYRRDSVMEVSQEEYNKCNSTHPIFFSNTGHTIFNLYRSGYFYFISGASGHCDKGQRMIVKVLEHDHDGDHNSRSSSSPASPPPTTFITTIGLLLFLLSLIET